MVTSIPDLINLAVEISNSDITLEELLDLGIEGLTEDIRYVMGHSYVEDCKTKVTNEEVFWYEYHKMGIAIGVLGSLIGGEYIAAKAAKILSKFKTGQKILKAAKDIEEAAS